MPTHSPSSHSDAPLATERRPLGPTSLQVSPVAFGGWPIAGVTTLDVSDEDSRATIEAALDHGINFIDTAYCYGRQGESESLIGATLAARPAADVVIASKGGIHYDAAGQQAQDARPATLRRQCEESLRRLRRETIDLYYLHAPDPAVPVAESAGAIRELLDEGKIRAAGASNCTLDELEQFAAACPLAAVQLPYNMLQRDIERRTLPWCRERGVAAAVYWPLMKGLLAGRIGSLEELPEQDSRRKYPMYQGEELARNLAFVTRLGELAAQRGCTVAQLVVNWTISQPGVTVALCGAKRPWQISETAGAMGWRLNPDELAAVEAAVALRGHAAAKRTFE
jgi:aryl-alcohol dehydrogenase-like predicted oxidoreductase